MVLALHKFHWFFTEEKNIKIQINYYLMRLNVYIMTALLRLWIIFKYLHVLSLKINIKLISIFLTF